MPSSSSDQVGSRCSITAVRRRRALFQTAAMPWLSRRTPRLCVYHRHRRSTTSTCTLILMSVWRHCTHSIVCNDHSLRSFSAFLAAARSAGDVENFRWQLLQTNCAILSFGTCCAFRAHGTEPLRAAVNVKNRGCISIDDELFRGAAR